MEEDWPEEEPGKAARLKAALLSRKAILGLAATAVLVTAAYFLAGDYLGGGEPAPVASGPALRQSPAKPAAGPGDAKPLEPPPAEPAGDPAAPEQVVARTYQEAGWRAAGRAAGRPPEPRPAEPAPRGAPAFSSAHFPLRIEATKMPARPWSSWFSTASSTRLPWSTIRCPGRPTKRSSFWPASRVPGAATAG